MSQILIVIDKAIIREPIVAALAAEGFTTTGVRTGREAIEQVRASPCDLVLLDVALSDIDGLAVLRTLRQEKLRQTLPVIMLASTADRNTIVQAARLGVRGVILKQQFSLAALVKRINDVLHQAEAGAPKGRADDSAPSEAPASTAAHVVQIDDTSALEALKSIKPIASRAEIDAHIEDAGELKALSPTVAQLMKATQSASASIDRIAGMIKQDQAIALKVLKMANSAVYTRGEPVESVQKAVMRIGLTQIRTLVMNIAVIERFADTSHPRLSTDQFWEHSIATGLIAATIARHQGRGEADIDAAFTMGLLHDVGRMIFLELLPDEYTRVVETADKLELPLEQVESRMLLVNHADLMDKVLRRWNFPKPLIDPIALHHLGIGNIRSLAPRMLTEVATLALANRLSHALLLGSSGNHAVYPIDPFVRALKLSPDVVEQIVSEVPDQTMDIKYAMLSQSNTHAWQDLATILRDTIEGEFRPIVLSAEPEVDAYRILCDRLRTNASTGEEPTPNVAIAHLTSARDRDVVAERLRAAEAEHSTGRLPLAILSANANLSLHDDVMAGREVRLLPSPIDLHRFTGAVGGLLHHAIAKKQEV